MLDIFFALLAASMSAGSGGGEAPQVAEAPAIEAPAAEAPVAEAPVAEAPAAEPETGSGSVVIGQGVIIGGAPATPTAPAPAPAPTPAPAAPAAQAGMNMAVVPAGLVAEPQVPSGRFLTAMEVKPILGATKMNWVAVREFNGQDLVYVTHLWSWRCGLAAMAISLNDEPMQNWPLPPCHDDTGSPNAILDEDGLPYLTLRLGSVQKVAIQIVYDDLTMERAEFARNQVLMP